MSDKSDFNLFMDRFIDGARNITDNLVEKGGEFAKESGLKDFKDYYPFYSWPPLNLYVVQDNSLVFEFGLPGFIKDDVSIAFEDDYLLFSATASNGFSRDSIIRSFKKKLKLRDIKQQKYYLPEDSFDRKNYSMYMKNGLLRVVFLKK